MRRALALLLLSCSVLPGMAADAAPAPTPPNPRWGAIASKDRWYGYASSYPTRAAAERAALAQCDRLARRQGACTIRTSYDRACSALAEGNYGEWGTAMAPTQAAANQEAARQCDAHLPAEPCKVVVSACSLR